MEECGLEHLHKDSMLWKYNAQLALTTISTYKTVSISTHLIQDCLWDLSLAFRGRIRAKVNDCGQTLKSATTDI